MLEVTEQRPMNNEYVNQQTVTSDLTFLTSSKFLSTLQTKKPRGQASNIL